jgi:hypothetical protein
MTDIPRRNQLNKCTPAELAISKAMEEVEKLRPDVNLTVAIMKLSEARDMVSDFIDESIDEDK